MTNRFHTSQDQHGRVAPNIPTPRSDGSSSQPTEAIPEMIASTPVSAAGQLLAT